MKSFLKIVLVFIYMIICLWAFGYTIDILPFTFSDLLVSLFAFGGVVYWAEFGVDYIFKLKEWIDSRKKGKN